MFDRRSILAGSSAAAGLLLAPRLAFARAATDKRLVFVIQRGAADGLSTLAPVGDPGFAAARGTLAEDFAAQPTLGGMFALHPALQRTAGLYAARQAAFIHAVASPYRERSHFDGQNVIETGGARPYALRDGWMNRLLGLLPAGASRALAISATVPAALRGTNEVSSYAPSALPAASDDLLQRVAMLYAGDAQLHALWEEAMKTRAMAGDLAADGGRGAAVTGKLAADLMAGPEGARVVMVETGGWDTHAGQKARLNAQFRGLDALLGALVDGLGPAWSDTLVIVATEFGRTVALNGTGGTDHGTASVAMLLGGAVAGGRIVADWPGLALASLHEGRDLRPTASLDAIMAGAIAQHFALDPRVAARTLFPGGDGRATGDLVRG